MDRFGQEWVEQLREHAEPIKSLVDLFRGVGAAVGSRGITRQGQLADRYLQNVAQLTQLCSKMGDLGEQLRDRAWRADPREDPKAAPVLKELQKTCTEAERLYGRLEDATVDWTLHEFIGTETGLAERLQEMEPVNPVNFEDGLDSQLEAFIVSITRRSYDFRPTLLRRRPHR